MIIIRGDKIAQPEKELFSTENMKIYTDVMIGEKGREYKQFIIAQIKKGNFQKNANGKNQWNVTFEDRKYLNEETWKDLVKYIQSLNIKK